MFNIQITVDSIKIINNNKIIINIIFIIIITMMMMMMKRYPIPGFKIVMCRDIFVFTTSHYQRAWPGLIKRIHDSVFLLMWPASM